MPGGKRPVPGRTLDLWLDSSYTCGMETIAIPITLLISVATFLITVGGVWFVTQKRVRDLELKTTGHDRKHEQILSEISDVKVEIARVQGSVMALNEKFDLFIQGRLIPATPSVAVGGV